MRAAQGTGDGSPVLLWGDEGAVRDGPMPARRPFLSAVPAVASVVLAAWSAIAWLGDALR